MSKSTGMCQLGCLFSVAYLRVPFSAFVLIYINDIYNYTTDTIVSFADDHCFFVMNPQVLCLDGLTSDYDPEDRCSNIDGEEGVFQDPIPEVVSVRPEVAEKWMDRFVVDLVENPSVSRKSAVARTFGPAVSEEYSPVVFTGGGGGGCRCIPPRWS